MKTKASQNMILFLVLLLALVPLSLAQEKPPSSTVTVQEAQKEEEDKTKEADQAKPQPVRSDTSMVDRMFSGVKNNAAISFRFTGNYDSNVLNSNVTREGATFETFSPRFFADIQRKRYQLDFDYSANYLLYNKISDLNRTDHLAGVAIRFRPSRHTYAMIGEHVSYSTNDFIIGSNELLAPTIIGNNPTQSVFFSRQRIFRNAVTGEIGYQINASDMVSFFGSYDVARYRNQPLNNLSGGAAGVRYEHRVTQRLFLNTDYSFSYYTYNNVLGISKIHTVGMGFRYLVRPSFTVFTWGGIQSATVQGLTRSGGAARFGFDKSSSTTSFGMEYSYQNTNQIGLATAVRSQSVSAHLRHRLSSKWDFTIDSAYSRNRLVFLQDLHINSVAVGAGLEYAVRPDLTFFANYGYVNQRSELVLLQVPVVSRNMVSIGFEFRFPRLRGK